MDAYRNHSQSTLDIIWIKTNNVIIGFVANVSTAIHNNKNQLTYLTINEPLHVLIFRNKAIIQLRMF